MSSNPLQFLPARGKFHKLFTFGFSICSDPITAGWIEARQFTPSDLASLLSMQIHTCIAGTDQYKKMFKFTQREKNLLPRIGKNLLQIARSLKSLQILLSMLYSLINLVYGVKAVQTVTYESLTTWTQTDFIFMFYV